MEEEVNRIKKILSDLGVIAEFIEHDAIISSENAAEMHGVELKQGVKSIVFTNSKGEFIVINIPADKKIDSKIVASKNGWSNSSTRIATPEEVINQTGCEIGAVPPFGHKNKMKIFFDTSIWDNDISLFNIGLKTHSVKIKTEDLKKVFTDLNLIEGSFVKI
jgi:prolyl-tRNA editing enzyme YbaK/EbsC (Cys-tRNA(Pro) deacylase)